MPDIGESLAAFTEQLSTLHEINLALSRLSSLDEICRQAVLDWRDRLDFDRIGIWLLCPDTPGDLCGTFGVDEAGQVRDERDQRMESDAPILEDILTHRRRVFHAVNRPLYNHRSQPVGIGETAASALWDGDQVIGFVVIDNLRFQRPISLYQREILYLFGNMLGHLASQKPRAATVWQADLCAQRCVVMMTLHLDGGLAQPFFYFSENML